MLVKEYGIEDYDMIKQWYEAHGMVAPDPDCFPRIGAVVEGVAAGFLFQTDSKIGLLENYISNPEAGPRERDTALNLITQILIETGRQIGLKSIAGFTSVPAIAKRAVKNGMTLDEKTYQLITIRTN